VSFALDSICMINISYQRLLLPLSFCPLLWLFSEPQTLLLSVVALSDHSCVTVLPLTVVCRPPADRGCSIWVSLEMCCLQQELMLVWALKTANLGTKYKLIEFHFVGYCQTAFLRLYIPNNVYTGWRLLCCDRLLTILASLYVLNPTYVTRIRDRIPVTDVCTISGTTRRILI
jgi:hypothetical protein